MLRRSKRSTLPVGPYDMVTVRVLTYLAPYVTAPSERPSDAVPPLVAIADLTRMSSDEEIWGCRWENWSSGVSEALRISLSEVQAWYFQDSDESKVWDLDN
jgi:hypothetical protein